ncbi:hypothetical protein DTO021C3_767 [Paecilomyces variotii]|nr:hypothetical protein DTO169C6_3114 [Paecilomyces variotii]KAJ9265872.1 hypothetical protein DTO195F2_1474 [Paecilomyces variotii]KAJ9291866.1 hypothetical protein DTO021C3_767 [Paecilomyces variotii]KAJ9399663.1 hypothetical protein DTO282F9_3537 [Paecilomyces variotii]
MRTNCGPSLTKPLLESLLRLLVPSSSASRTAERLVRSPWRRVPVRRVLLGQSVGRNGRSGHELLSIYRVTRSCSNLDDHHKKRETVNDVLDLDTPKGLRQHKKNHQHQKKIVGLATPQEVPALKLSPVPGVPRIEFLFTTYATKRDANYRPRWGQAS